MTNDFLKKFDDLLRLSIGAGVIVFSLIISVGLPTLVVGKMPEGVFYLLGVIVGVLVVFFAIGVPALLACEREEKKRGMPKTWH